MANSSPASRGPAPASGVSRSSLSPGTSYHSPARPELSEFLLESRNSPEAHRRAYEEAKREHGRVLSAAIQVFELHQLAEETRRIQEEEQRRQERMRLEERRVEEERRIKQNSLEDEARLQALKAKPIPKPAIPPPQAPPVESSTRPSDSVSNRGLSQQPDPLNNGFSALNTPSTNPGPPAKAGSNVRAATMSSTASTALPSTPFASLTAAPSSSARQQTTASAFTPQKAQPLEPAAVANGQSTSQQLVNGGSTSVAPTQAEQPVVDRYIEIHKKLKYLRKFVLEQAKSNPELKAKTGEMRREIRKSIGQLTNGGLKENRTPVANIIKTLKESLQKQSVLIDPNEFLLEPRQPVEGASRNEPQLPSLFLYLLNQLAKAVISQFINESGADTRTADSIGQVVAKVFSDEEFLWRGKPLIDVLIAKYRVVCPVLFGFRGNDKMQQGRLRVGWRKEGGEWVSEQTHSDRMTGLGAGFAAMTLRDFSKVKRPNPWPPTAYWSALAKILNTPVDQISMTQCYVLKAMIADNEQSFIKCYGSAAIAALRCALIEFPARVPEKTSASEALKVQAKSLILNTGLRLDQS